jgi:hypothetical protein
MHALLTIYPHDTMVIKFSVFLTILPQLSAVDDVSRTHRFCIYTPRNCCLCFRQLGPTQRYEITKLTS